MNECLGDSNPCPEGATCNNQPGWEPWCACPEGTVENYNDDWTVLESCDTIDWCENTCSDIDAFWDTCHNNDYSTDECQDPTNAQMHWLCNHCGGAQTCVDSDGGQGFECTCPAGFEEGWLKDDPGCDDWVAYCPTHSDCVNINECGGTWNPATGDYDYPDCDSDWKEPVGRGDWTPPTEQCVDKEGKSDAFPRGYDCACMEGYEKLDGADACTDIDECAGDHGCVSPSVCVNMVGKTAQEQQQCTCPAGYDANVEEEQDCRSFLAADDPDYVECSAPYRGMCDPMAWGQCMLEWRIASFECVNTNECAGDYNPCGMKANCVDKDPATQGGTLYTCVCATDKSFTGDDTDFPQGCRADKTCPDVVCELEDKCDTVGTKDGLEGGAGCATGTACTSLGAISARYPDGVRCGPCPEGKVFAGDLRIVNRMIMRGWCAPRRTPARSSPRLHGVPTAHFIPWPRLRALLPPCAHAGGARAGPRRARCAASRPRR